MAGAADPVPPGTREVAALQRRQRRPALPVRPWTWSSTASMPRLERGRIGHRQDRCRLPESALLAKQWMAAERRPNLPHRTCAAFTHCNSPRVCTCWSAWAPGHDNSIRQGPQTGLISGGGQPRRRPCRAAAAALFSARSPSSVWAKAPSQRKTRHSSPPPTWPLHAPSWSWWPFWTKATGQPGGSVFPRGASTLCWTALVSTRRGAPAFVTLFTSPYALAYLSPHAEGTRVAGGPP